MEQEFDEKIALMLAMQEQILALLQHLHGAAPQQQWLDATDVKTMLKISRSTLYRYKKQGILKPFLMRGKEYFSFQQINKLINRPLLS